MIDNKILKHKYLFIFLVFAFSVLFGKLEVNAEESEYKRIHITTYYNQPGSDFPYREQVFDCWPLANIALVVKDLEKGQYYFATDNPSGFRINFHDVYTTTVKRYNSNMDYCDEYLQEESKTAYFYDDLIQHPEYYFDLVSDWKPIETDIPIFKDAVSCKAYFETGDTSGQINKPLECIFDESIEMPVVHFPNFTKDNIDYTCFITNSTDKYYIEVQGRCHTFDDIELYKDKIYFKTREYTKLKNDLTTWISYKDSIQSKGEHDIADYAKNSFDNLLSLYPVDSRNIFGGTNAVGDFFSGYSAVLNQVKNDLATLRSHFNIIEFYIRFYYIDNNVVHYGKWCHVYNFVTDKDNLIYQSDIGMDDDEKNSLENSSDSLNDNNASNNLSQSAINSLNDDSLWNVIKNLVAGLGDFPELVRSVFSFMPDWLFNILAFGISFIIILRFLGR